jgi:hypothetical protein
MWYEYVDCIGNFCEVFECGDEFYNIITAVNYLGTHGSVVG